MPGGLTRPQRPILGQLPGSSATFSVDDFHKALAARLRARRWTGRRSGSAGATQRAVRDKASSAAVAFTRSVKDEGTANPGRGYGVATCGKCPVPERLRTAGFGP